MNFWIKNEAKNEVTYRHRFLIDFWSIFGPFLEPKSVQNRFQSGFGRALNEGSISKLKKERSKSIEGAGLRQVHGWGGAPWHWCFLNILLGNLRFVEAKRQLLTLRWGEALSL